MRITHHHTKNRQKTDTFISWQNMKARCTNSNHNAYKNYGGRGITVCLRWFSFENFLADMGERPAGKTLERLDNEKGYFPENCIWADRKAQANNKRIQVNNRIGITGVYFHKRTDKWEARNAKDTIYYGKDFFEACCARKKFESTRRLLCV